MPFFEWLIPRAIAGVLATSGCPAVTKNTVPTQVTAEEEFGSTIGADKALATGIKGKVLMPANLLSADGTKINDNASAIGEQPRQGRQGLLDRPAPEGVPEFGKDTTGASGEFAFKPIAANNVWLIKADFGGVTAATFAVPLLKKEVSVEITLASTVASAGLLPLFTTAKPKAYLVRDLDMKKYGALVAAVAAFMEKGLVPVKPLRALSEMATPFGKMMTSAEGAAVKKAYEDIVGDLKVKSQLRAAGKASAIKPPQDTIDDPADPGQSDGPDQSHGPHQSWSAGAGLESNHRNGERSAERDAQLPVLHADDVGAGPLDGDSRRQPHLAVGRGLEAHRRRPDAGGQVFQRGARHPASGHQDLHHSQGRRRLQRAGDHGLSHAEAEAAIKVTGESACGRLVGGRAEWHDAPGGRRAQPHAGEINTSTGVATLYAGTPGLAGKTTTKTAAAKFSLSRPTGLAKNGTDVFVADRDNNRVLKIANDQIEQAVGAGVQNFKSGALLEGQMTRPESIDFGGTAKHLLIVLPSKNAIMVADDKRLIALATEETKAGNGADMITNPTGAIHHGGNICCCRQRQVDEVQPFP